MKNFEITSVENNKKYWISRAVAVCAILVVYDNEEIPHILINKRGPGTPDYQGCWNIPCGYLDWDESTSEACTREILEECKVYINKENWSQFGEIEDSPSNNNQNVTVRKIAIIDFDSYLYGLSTASKMNETEGGEINEVDDIMLMPLSNIEIESKKWAFNHKALLYEIKNKLEEYEYN